jgi:hypothetical protein
VAKAKTEKPEESNDESLNDELSDESLNEAAPDVDISELMKLGHDRPRPPMVRNTAKVFCPGLPNPEGGWGVWCEVRRLDQMGETRLMARINESYFKREVGVPGYEDMTDDEKWTFWTKVHKLQLGVVKPRIDLQAGIALVATPAGNGVAKPLLEAIEKINLTASQVDEIQLDQQDIALYPSIQKMWMAAARENKLVEFMDGDPNITEPIRRWIRTVTATQMLVLEEQAKVYARETGKEIGEVLSPQLTQIIKLLYELNGYETPEPPPENAATSE